MRVGVALVSFEARQFFFYQIRLLVPKNFSFYYSGQEFLLLSWSILAEFMLPFV